MIYTTLNKIRACGPCENGWVKLLKHLRKTSADDEPLALLTILDANGLNDTLWCLRTVPEHDRTWRLFAVWCARQVQHLMQDQRSIAALDIAERYANGLATAEELTAARDTAWAAAGVAAWAAGAAAGAAAKDAAWAAEAAAKDAAWAAGAAAKDAARAAGDAGDAAWAAWAAAKDAQEKELRRICIKGNKQDQESNQAP